MRPLLQESFQDRPLSATYLDDFAKCPWKFFARRHLKLDEAEEWILEIEPKTKGRLAHSLLEKIYLNLIEGSFSQGKIPDEQERRKAVELALVSCVEAWQGTAEFQQLPPRLRQEEIHRLEQRVSRFLQMEAELWGKAGVPLFPTQLEWRFGKAPHPPVSFSMKDGTQVALSGSIDRVDYNPQTGEYLLMDYKNARSEELASELRRGLNYQLFLYLTAATQALYPKGRPLGALYGDLKESKKNQGMVSKEGMRPFGIVKGVSKSFLKEEEFSERQQQLAEGLDQLLQNIFAGGFSLNPVECQGEHCPYHEICRYDRQPR